MANTDKQLQELFDNADRFGRHSATIGGIEFIVRVRTDGIVVVVDGDEDSREGFDTMDDALHAAADHIAMVEDATLAEMAHDEPSDKFEFEALVGETDVTFKAPKTLAINEWMRRALVHAIIEGEEPTADTLICLKRAGTSEDDAFFANVSDLTC